MNFYKSLFLTLFLMLSLTFQSIGQEVEMADVFRSEGKIYVVIAVISIVFLVIAAYLINLDLKLKKLEQQFKEKLGNKP